MRLESFGASHASLSRLGWSGLFALAVCASGAAAFAASGLRGFLIDAAAPPSVAWRAPSFVATGRPSAKPSAPGDATLSRPLFAKSRRPFEGQKRGLQASDATKGPEGMTLRGVVDFHGKKQAFIVTSALADGQWLGVGQALEGWTVAEMGGAFVMMQNGGRSARLEIDYGERQPQSREAPPPSTAAPPHPITAHPPIGPVYPPPANLIRMR